MRRRRPQGLSTRARLRHARRWPRALRVLRPRPREAAVRSGWRAVPPTWSRGRLHRAQCSTAREEPSARADAGRAVEACVSQAVPQPLCLARQCLQPAFALVWHRNGCLLPCCSRLGLSSSRWCLHRLCDPTLGMSPPARYVVPAVPLLESERRLRGRLLDPSLSHAVWRAPDLEPLLFLLVISDAQPPVEFSPCSPNEGTGWGCDRAPGMSFSAFV